MGQVMTDVLSFEAASGITEGAKDFFGDLDLTGSKATGKAIDAQTAAAREANQTMKDIYNQQRADLEPWRQTGMRALSGLEANDFMKDWQQDPGYQFRLAEGEKAINAAAAARGMAGSGATMKALTRYGQDFATNEYDKVYGRQYNRLSSLAGIGNNATSNMVNVAGNYGAGVAGNQMGLGNAIGSAHIAQSNRMGNMVGQGAGMAAIAFSDERLKTNVEPISKEDLAEMKRFLRPFKFNYISEKFGQGDWIGVMAQDLEKSKLGRTLVVIDENGHKMIDIRKVMSLFLATLAEA
jgi:hypothetical protein